MNPSQPGDIPPVSLLIDHTPQRVLASWDNTSRPVSLVVTRTGS